MPVAAMWPSRRQERGQGARAPVHVHPRVRGRLVTPGPSERDEGDAALHQQARTRVAGVGVGEDGGVDRPVVVELRQQPHLVGRVAGAEQADPVAALLRVLGDAVGEAVHQGAVDPVPGRVEAQGDGHRALRVRHATSRGGPGVTCEKVSVTKPPSASPSPG